MGVSFAESVRFNAVRLNFFSSSIGWQIKKIGSPGCVGTNTESLWEEGEVLSTNHGRIVVLPYIKENGEHVAGHTQ